MHTWVPPLAHWEVACFYVLLILNNHLKITRNSDNTLASLPQHRCHSQRPHMKKFPLVGAINVKIQMST